VAPGTFDSERIERLERAVLLLLRKYYVQCVAGATDTTTGPRARAGFQRMREEAIELIDEVQTGQK
jgi:hypothetical protein